jgi:N-acetyl-gamma-glutamyl-phosphate reductase
MGEQKVKAGIIGGAGYTGGELTRLLLNHPNTELTFVHSKSQAGKPVSTVHTDLLGETELYFSNSFAEAVDVLFLCVGHGEAKKFLADNIIPANVKIIDLSQDFRWDEETVGTQTIDGRTFVYGLPELQRDTIQQAQYIANPGCFATAIQLALLPLAANALISDVVHVSGITGSTGAGQSFSTTSHYSWRSGNISNYKVLNHQHLNEIRRTLHELQPQKDLPAIHFVPYRGPFTRGILCTSYLPCNMTIDEAQALYSNYYSSHPFVWLSNSTPDLKQVVNTNKCIIYLEKQGEMLVITSMIDNLLKGASGQAVQNMNLLYGLEETAGLKLKPSGF